MIGTGQDALDKAGVRGTTDTVFTSDNGYHMGEYRLTPGNQTAFETDVHVPLVVTGPGIKAGATVHQPVQNIDLRPTFETLAGAPTPTQVDGESLPPLLTGPTASLAHGRADRAPRAKRCPITTAACDERGDSRRYRR